MIGKHSKVKSTCNRNYLNVFTEEHNGFLQDCSITFVDKINKCLKQWLFIRWIGSTKLFNTLTWFYVHVFIRGNSGNFVKCTTISVFFLLKKLAIPSPLLLLVYYRDQRHTPRGIAIEECSEGMQLILGEAPVHLWNHRVISI